MRLDIREENGKRIVHIPCPDDDFGSNFFKSNLCEMKIQYAYGLAGHYDSYKQHLVTDVIKEVTGADDVNCEWVEEMKNRLKQNIPPKDIYVNMPIIDHQSRDLYYDVFEDKDTIKDFIFNPNSWLYGGSDADDNAYLRQKETIYSNPDEVVVFVFHFGHNIGDLEIERSSLFYLDTQDQDIFNDPILTGLCFDTSKQEFLYKELRPRISDDTKPVDPILYDCMLIRNKDGEYFANFYRQDKNWKVDESSIVSFKVNLFSKKYGKIQ